MPFFLLCLTRGIESAHTTDSSLYKVCSILYNLLHRTMYGTLFPACEHKISFFEINDIQVSLRDFISMNSTFKWHLFATFFWTPLHAEVYKDSSSIDTCARWLSTSAKHRPESDDIVVLRKSQGGYTALSVDGASTMSDEPFRVTYNKCTELYDRAQEL